jgi:GYF domain 2
MVERWYRQLDGAEDGTYPSNLLVEMAATGQIHRDTLVRKGEGGRWIPAWRVAGLFADDATDSAWLTIGDETDAPVFAEAVPERRKLALTITLASAALVFIVVAIVWAGKLRADRQQQTKETMVAWGAKVAVAHWLKRPNENLEFGDISVTNVYRLSTNKVGDAHRSDYECCRNLWLVLGRARLNALSGEERQIRFVVHDDDTSGEVTLLAPDAEGGEERFIRENTVEGAYQSKSIPTSDPFKQMAADSWIKGAERRPLAYSDLLQTMSYYASLNR